MAIDWGMANASTVAAAQPQEVPAEQRPEVCGEHAPGQTQDVACTLPKSHEGNHCHAWSTVKFFWPAQKEIE